MVLTHRHLIEENRRVNGGCSNVSWRVGDATELQLPGDCCDVLFSNWLLMYLSDAEVTSLGNRALSWVSASYRLAATHGTCKMTLNLSARQPRVELSGS